MRQDVRIGTREAAYAVERGIRDAIPGLAGGGGKNLWMCLASNLARAASKPPKLAAGTPEPTDISIVYNIYRTKLNRGYN